MPTFIDRSADGKIKVEMQFYYTDTRGKVHRGSKMFTGKTKAAAEKKGNRAWPSMIADFEKRVVAAQTSGDRGRLVDLLERYLKRAEKVEVNLRTGKQRFTVDYIRALYNTWKKTWPNMLTTEFDIRAVDAFIELRVTEGGNGKRGAATSTLNKYIDEIQKFIRWGCRKGLLGENASMILVNLKRFKDGEEGRAAREVLPAPPDAVKRVREKASKVVGDLIYLHDVQGVRNMELLLLKGEEIDRDNWKTKDGHPVWVADIRHRAKTEPRLLVFGPKAQAVLRPRILAHKPNEYLFSPQEAIDENAAKRTCATRGEKRKDGQPGGRTWQRKNPSKTKRRVGNHYTNNSYCTAVKRVCQRIRDTEDPDFPIFTPHQLRHTYATRNARKDLQMTRTLLDQKDDETTKIYLTPEQRAEIQEEQEKLRLPDRIEWQWSNG